MDARAYAVRTPIMALVAVIDSPPELMRSVYGPPADALNARLNFPSGPAVAVAMAFCGSPVSLTIAPAAADPVTLAPAPEQKCIHRT